MRVVLPAVLFCAAIVTGFALEWAPLRPAAQEGLVCGACHQTHSVTFLLAEARIGNRVGPFCAIRHQAQSGVFHLAEKRSLGI